MISLAEYVKSALYYKNKDKFHDCIDEHEDESTEDEVRDDARVFIRDLLSGVQFPDAETESLVRATMDAGIDWHLVQRNLTGELKRKYSEKMREIKAYAKDNLQSNRMLQTR